MAARELRTAAAHGDCGKLRELLDGGGASIVDERTEVTDTGKKFRTTALIAAVAYNQHTAVKLLLEHSANPNLADSRGGTPLMEAAAAAPVGHLRILQTLLDRKDIAIDVVHPETGYTAFHFACLMDHADCTVELARGGCDTTLRTQRGETGKDVAERKEHTAVLAGLRALVAEQLRVKVEQQAAACRLRALQLLPAVQDGDCDKLRELLVGGVTSVVDERIEMTDAAGQKVQVTALTLAVDNNQLGAVKLLLEHGADVNRPDSRGTTPLMQAANHGHLPILRTLLDRKAIAIDAADKETDTTAFHMACFRDQADCAVELARRGCDMRLRTKHGMTGKEIAERKKHTAVLEELRALVVPSLVLTTVHELRIAAKSGDCGKLRELLDGGGASVVDERTEVTYKGTGAQVQVKTTALLQAVAHGQHSAVELLLEHKANPNLADSFSCTPLAIAAEFGHLHILQTLLDRKAIDIDAADTEDGYTAFHLACFYGQADCAVELARSGCEMTLQCENGMTGKELAEHKKHTAVLAELRALVVEQRRAKQQSNDDDSEDQQQDDSLPPLGVTAVHELRSAAAKGDCGKLRELLGGGGASVVNERTEVTNTETLFKETGIKLKTTALLQAVVYDQHDAVELLLEHKANPNLADSLGYTPLMTAAIDGHLRILRTLLDREDVVKNAVNVEEGFTAFDYACGNSDCAATLTVHYGNADCAVELVRHGCNTKLHGVPTKRCQLVQKLALRKAQQQPIDNAVSSAAAAGCVPQADETAEQQKKAVKKAAANRKKKDRKKAKKAAEQQQLVSQAEPELEQSYAQLQPDAELQEEPECPVQQTDAVAQAQAPAEAEVEPEATLELQAEPEPEPEPVLDERMQQLQALTALNAQHWSAAQVLEWVALIVLPPESMPAVISAMESLDLDGDELLLLPPKTLQKKLTKYEAHDAEALAKQMIEQRDALLLPGDSTATTPAATTPKLERPEGHECPICMELFGDDESGQRIPRFLTNCGHTVCHGCITDMLALVTAKNGKKACKCPTCSKVTNVKGGNAANLHKNYALL